MFLSALNWNNSTLKTRMSFFRANFNNKLQILLSFFNSTKAITLVPIIPKGDLNFYPKIYCTELKRLTVIKLLGQGNLAPARHVSVIQYGQTVTLAELLLWIADPDRDRRGQPGNKAYGRDSWEWGSYSAHAEGIPRNEIASKCLKKNPILTWFLIP